MATKEKESLWNADSAMNSKATPVQKHSTILIKNHSLYTGQTYQVKEVKRNGDVITEEGHFFCPEFFDVVSDWQPFNGGFGRFNLTTGELVEEKSIKKEFLDRLEINDGRDGWVNFIVLQVETGLNPHQLRDWLEANKGTLVERNKNPKDPTDEEWRLLVTRLRPLAVGSGDRSRTRGGNSKSPSSAGDRQTFDVVTGTHRLNAGASSGIGCSHLKDGNNSSVLRRPEDNAPSPSTNDGEKLSPDERERLHYLESLIETSFVVVGRSLREIRDNRLYREQYANFENYCRTKWRIGKHLANRQIIASEIFDNIKVTICHQHDSINGDNLSPSQIPLPTKESQLRPLTSLISEPDRQAIAWQLAVAENQGKVPTAKIVEKVVKEMTQGKPKNSWKVGDVCKYVEVTGKSSVWCVVRSVNDFSCTVDDYLEKDVQVRPDELKSLELPKEEEEFMRSLLPRLQVLSDTDSAVALHALSFFGKLTRGYLSEKEEAILKVLEI